MGSTPEKVKSKILQTVGYIRVSTQEQAERGASLGAQKDYLGRWSKEEDLNLVQIYEDDASGATLSRPGLQSMLRRISKGEIQVVLVVHDDRLSRNTLDREKLRKWFQERGIQLRCGNIGVDITSPEGEMMFTTMGGLAQYMRKDLGRKTKMGMDRRREEGVWTGRAPWGFSVENGRLKLVDQRILRIWSLKDNGYFQKAIALELDLSETQVSRTIKKRKILEPITQARDPGPQTPSPQGSAAHRP